MQSFIRVLKKRRGQEGICMTPGVGLMAGCWRGGWGQPREAQDWCLPPGTLWSERVLLAVVLVGLWPLGWWWVGEGESRRGRVSRHHCSVQKPGACLAGQGSDLLCWEFRKERIQGLRWEIKPAGRDPKEWLVPRVDVCLGIPPSLSPGHTERRGWPNGHGAAMSKTLACST